MSTSPLYHTTRQALARALPNALDTQLDTLSLFLLGAIHAVSAQLGRMARAVPLRSDQVIKEQRLRRFLDNPRITQQGHYQPLIQQALHGLTGQRVQLLIDRVLLRNQTNILVVSIGFRRRSLPLIWKILPHRGASGLDDQKKLLAAAIALLPEKVRISVHGDSEFRSRTLYSWLRDQGCDALMGIRGDVRIFQGHDDRSAGKPLVAFVPPREEPRTSKRHTHRHSPVVYLSTVAVGEEDRVGPVNVLAWWERDDDGIVVLHAVMTNLPANAQTKAYGTRRMWIETAFRDWQSGGFQLERSGVEDRGRVERLLLVLAIAYLWFVSVGRWVVKRGYRREIDDGGPRNWKYSLFQLGVGWKEHLASWVRAMPVLFHIYI